MFQVHAPEGFLAISPKVFTMRRNNVAVTDHCRKQYLKLLHYRECDVASS